MTNVHPASILRDPRFTLQENWETVAAAVEEGKSRGLMITAVTVFDIEGGIRGWYLHGWKRPSPSYTYIPPTVKEQYVGDWVI